MLASGIVQVTDTLTFEAAFPTRTMVPTCPSTKHHILNDHSQDTHHQENLKSHGALYVSMTMMTVTADIIFCGWYRSRRTVFSCRQW